MYHKKGEIVEGKVVDFGSKGEGIVKDGAFPIFVPFAIKGEDVKVKLNYVNRDYAFGDIIEVLTPSSDRVKPRCPYFGKCGGCDLLHINMDRQLEIKRQSVANVLKKNAGIDYDVPLPIHVRDWDYRNKLSVSFGYNKYSNRVVIGFFEKNSHHVIPMKWCPLHGEWAATVIKIVQDWANNKKIKVYDEKTHTGLLRHLVVRCISTLTVTLVVNGDSVPYLDELSKELSENFEDVAIYVCPNKENTNVILGKTIKLVYGKEYKQNLGAYSAYVSPLSFLQVNNEVKDLIYDEACSALSDYDGDLVELYSGVGLLTAQIAMRLRNAQITSVEIVPSAVETAKQLMKSLNIDDRVKCICDDACNFIKSINPDVKHKWALVLDPPRKGCSKEVLDAIIYGAFEKIEYISCSPATLARDLNVLKNYYSIESIKTYDMFPQTSHVETVVGLCLKGKSNE